MLEELRHLAHSYMLYPIVMGIAWGVAFNYIKFRIDYSELKHFYLLFATIFISSWIGAKILFLLTIPTHETIYNRYDFWSGGGFVFFGGLLLAIISTLFACLIRPSLNHHLQQNSQHYLKALLFGHAIGRIGCFLVGCCYGSEWYGVQLPVQLMESVGLMLLLYKFPKQNSLPENLAYYLGGYAVLRFCLEFIRSDIERGEILHMAPSQLIAAIILLVMVGWKLKRLRF